MSLLAVAFGAVALVCGSLLLWRWYGGETEHTVVTRERTTYKIEYSDGDTDEVEAHRVRTWRQEKDFYLYDDVNSIDRFGSASRDETKQKTVSMHNVKSIEPVSFETDTWENVPVK